MGRRIAVLHQGFIPVYRVRLFEMLNSVTGDDYVIFHGDPPRGVGHQAVAGPFQFPNVRVDNREIAIGRSSLIYQPVLQAIRRGGFDALIVGHEFKFVASMLLFAWFKAMGRPALLWGHGLHRPNALWPARASSRLLARAADAYLVYTPRGREKLAAAGVDADRIFVARNTLDITAQQHAMRRLDGATTDGIRSRFGLRTDSRVLLSIGRLIPRKAVDALIAATRMLNADPTLTPIEVVVAGDGPERNRLEAEAQDLRNLRFLGNRYDPDEVAALMKVATAVVLPGTVGLAVNHAFACGRPVVTRQNPLHPPEIEYIEPDRNGLVAGPGVDDLADALSRLLRDDALQQRLAAGAAATGQTLTLDHTVSQFDAAVRFALDLRRRTDGRADAAAGRLPAP